MIEFVAFFYTFFHKMVQKAAKLTAIFQQLNKKGDFAFFSLQTFYFSKSSKKYLSSLILHGRLVLKYQYHTKVPYINLNDTVSYSTKEVKTTMLEKRRSQRIPIDVHLHICDLYRQDVSGIHHLEVPLVLTHISEHGVGFISESILPPQCQFHACITLGTMPGFLVTLNIINCSAADHSHYAYDCEFIELEDSFRALIRERFKDSGNPEKAEHAEFFTFYGRDKPASLNISL